jgi:hypothetical protein
LKDGVFAAVFLAVTPPPGTAFVRDADNPNRLRYNLSSTSYATIEVEPYFGGVEKVTVYLEGREHPISVPLRYDHEKAINALVNQITNGGEYRLQDLRSAVRMIEKHAAALLKLPHSERIRVIDRVSDVSRNTLEALPQLHDGYLTVHKEMKRIHDIAVAMPPEWPATDSTWPTTLPEWPATLPEWPAALQLDDSSSGVTCEFPVGSLDLGGLGESLKDGVFAAVFLALTPPPGTAFVRDADNPNRLRYNLSSTSYATIEVEPYFGGVEKVTVYLEGREHPISVPLK